MTARQRPGPELEEAEILAALLSDAIDGLESFQATSPAQGIEDVIGSLRFVRYRLVKCIPAGIAHGQEVGDGTEVAQ